jgi:hypothetical protein
LKTSDEKVIYLKAIFKYILKMHDVSMKLQNNACMSLTPYMVTTGLRGRCKATPCTMTRALRGRSKATACTMTRVLMGEEQSNNLYNDKSAYGGGA